MIADDFKRQRWQLNWNGIAIILILALATLARFWSIDFGLPGKYRPDEEYLISRAVAFQRGDLNPHFFIYPTLSMYCLSLGLLALRGWNELTGYFGGQDLFGYLMTTAYAPAHLIGRLLAASYGVATVALLYCFGAQLFGRAVGLLAALALALNFSHVRESHFATSDTLLVLLSTAALWHMLKFNERANLRNYIVCGLFCGLAVSAKYPGVALFPVFLWVHLWTSIRSNQRFLTWRHLRNLGIFVFASALAFFLTSPYVLLDFSTFVANWRVQLNYLKFGVPTSGPQGLQWAIFAFWYAAGPGFLVLTGIGALYVLLRVRMQFKTKGIELALIIFPLLTLGLLLPSKLLYFRYVIMLMPLICLLAGLAIVWLWNYDSKKFAYVLLMRTLTMLIFAFGLYDSGQRVFAFNRLLSRPDTRNEAREFLEKNIPPGSTILVHSTFFYGKPELPHNYFYRDFITAKIDPQSMKSPPEWVLVDEYPGLPMFSPPLKKSLKDYLEQNSEKVKEISPFLNGINKGIFDPPDAFYAPLSDFSDFERTGPKLTFYRLKEPFSP